MTHRILFFDIDGTMLSTGGAGQRAMELALTEEFGVQSPFDEIVTAGRTDWGISDEVFARYQLKDNSAERERFMKAYLERLPDCLRRCGGGLLPGVRELLDGLVQHEHCVLSLLTGNYVEGAWIKLRHFQLDHYFQFGAFGDHHALRDDVARLALSNACLHMKRTIEGDCAWVIGDTPADIRCARAINARAVAVATGIYSFSELQPHAPDHLLENFSRTDEVLQILSGIRPAMSCKNPPLVSGNR